MTRDYPTANTATYDPLRAPHVNPRYQIQLQRREMFRGLGLVRAGEPPRVPRTGRRCPPLRAWVLTMLGVAPVVGLGGAL